jgi:hypothetical protein
MQKVLRGETEMDADMPESVLERSGRWPRRGGSIASTPRVDARAWSVDTLAWRSRALGTVCSKADAKDRMKLDAVWSNACLTM